jgi:ParB family chromosome partitioning protein
MNKTNRLLYNTGNNEWYTPLLLIEAARKTMGSIDTDPASSDKANEAVKAGQYYTKETDGLNKQWSGNTWLNPPYQVGLIDRFANAVTEKFVSGEIAQAIVLTNNATETKWFQKLLSAASAVCTPHKRVRFVRPDGTKGQSPLQGQTIFYFGPNIESFKENFGKFGVITTILQNRTLEIFTFDEMLIKEKINYKF